MDLELGHAGLLSRFNWYVGELGSFTGSYTKMMDDYRTLCTSKTIMKIKLSSVSFYTFAVFFIYIFIMKTENKMNEQEQNVSVNFLPDWKVDKIKEVRLYMDISIF